MPGILKTDGVAGRLRLPMRARRVLCIYADFPAPLSSKKATAQSKVGRCGCLPIICFCSFGIFSFGAFCGYGGASFPCRER